MEVLELRPSVTGHPSPDISSRLETSFERVKRYFSLVPSTPSATVVVSSEPDTQLQQTISSATSIATAKDSSLATSTSATSILTAYETFQIQGIHVSPSMPVDQETSDFWAQQIRFRLLADLHHHDGLGPWLLQFMMAGKRPDDLTPYIVITCGNVRTKKKVEKFCKDLKWLRQLARTYNIKLAALVTNITLNSGPAPLAIGTQAPENLCLVEVVKSTRTHCGQAIYIKHSESSSANLCTFGGVIEIDGKLYGLTAGHPFAVQRATTDESEMDVGEQSLESPMESDTSEADTTSDSDFVFSVDFPDDGSLSDTSSTYANDASPMITRIGSCTIPNLDSSSNTSLAAAATQVHVLLPVVPSFLNLPRSHLNFTLDWALIDVTNLSPILPNRIFPLQDQDGDGTPILGALPTQFEPHGNVTVLTSTNGPQLGVLSASPSTLKIHGHLYDVRLITLNHILVPGSSGALVVFDRYVCGLIIASRPDVPWAYMIPIHPVLDGIKKVLKATNVSFPSLTDLAKLSGLPSSDSATQVGEIASSSRFKSSLEKSSKPIAVDLEKGVNTGLGLPKWKVERSNEEDALHPENDEAPGSEPLLDDLYSWQQESEYVYASLPPAATRQLVAEGFALRVGNLFTDFLASVFLACFDFLCRAFR